MRLNPEEILTQEAMTRLHRTVIGQKNLENNQMKILYNALKAEMKKELTPQ